MNIVINIFLCSTFYIMIAGLSTYIYQQFGINKTITSLIIAVITYYIFLKNIDSITKINSIIIPILILTIIILGIKNISNISTDKIILNKGISWAIQAIIYTSYNIILLIPVLINLNKYIKNRKQVINISIITGIIIFIISSFVFLLLININQDIKNIEMPIIYVIEKKFNNFKAIYGIVILIAIFTTEISSGISFLNNICKNKKRFTQFSAMLCITSIIISQISFSTLVNILFPIFGYIGLIQIYFILKKE